MQTAALLRLTLTCWWQMVAYTWTKNNPEGRDKPKGLQCVTGCEGAIKKGADGKWVAPRVLCPVHIGWHAKVLQARDAGVPVEELEAPVFCKVAQLSKVPAGVTLVVGKERRDAVQSKVGRLVLVITHEQEEQGLMYDGSQPFLLNGQKFRPPPRGVWFVPEDQEYAVFAWASAAGVTHRIRKMMRKVNGRSEEEQIPEAVIEKLSSRSLRIGMATLLSHRGVPMEEIVANGEWEDAEMALTYIRSLDPLAVQRRNMTNVIFPVGTSAAGVGASTDAGASAGAGVSAVVTVPPQDSAMEVVEMPVVSVRSLPELKKIPSECMPCHPEKWQKGKVFKRDNLVSDLRLRGLLQDYASAKPAAMQKVLCNAGYCTTRKEITNYRERQALHAMGPAPEVEAPLLLQAISEELEGA